MQKWHLAGILYLFQHSGISETLAPTWNAAYLCPVLLLEPLGEDLHVQYTEEPDPPAEPQGRTRLFTTDVRLEKRCLVVGSNICLIETYSYNRGGHKVPMYAIPHAQLHISLDGQCLK